MHGAVLRLSGRLLVLALLLSAAVALAAAGVFAAWWYGVIGGGLFVLFLASGGLLVPSARSRLREGEARSGAALLVAFGTLCTLEVLIMGMVTWAYGNRTLAGNNAYQALGLVIFLSLIGAGIGGTVVTLARFAYLWSREHPPLERGAAHA